MKVAKAADSDGREYWTILGPVIIPDIIDTQNDTTNADAVRRISWDWFTSGRTSIDIDHDYRDRASVMPVESFIAREGDPDFPVGSWIVRCITYDPTIAQRIESGELSAYSWAGTASSEPVLALVKHPIEASGTTEICTSGPFPPHSHNVSLHFGEDAAIEKTHTMVTFAHAHEVVGATRTEIACGHAHGLRIVWPEEDSDADRRTQA